MWGKIGTLEAQLHQLGGELCGVFGRPATIIHAPHQVAVYVIEIPQAVYEVAFFSENIEHKFSMCFLTL
jgi:hypothetical protein